MDNNNEMILAPIGGQVMSQLSLGMEADAEHPNFIESNTQGITFEELNDKNTITRSGAYIKRNTSAVKTFPSFFIR